MALDELSQEQQKQAKELAEFLKVTQGQIQKLAEECRTKGFYDLSAVLFATLASTYGNAVGELMEAIRPFLLEERTRLAFERKKKTGEEM